MSQSFSTRTPRTIFTLLLLLIQAGTLSACRGGVKHPDDGGPNSEKYCADRNNSENNCMACSSQPGCGWCDSPRAGEAHCQPGTSPSIPGTCSSGWAQNTEDCATPPPPPPPPGDTSPPPATLEPSETATGPTAQSDASSEPAQAAE